MPYGYLGQTTPNQLASNSGVLSMSDVESLNKQGKLGGSLEHIKTENPSSSAAVNFLSIKESKYDIHLIQFLVKPDGDGTTQIRFSTNGGTTWVATGYDYAMDLSDSLGNPNTANNVNGTSIKSFASAEILKPIL